VSADRPTIVPEPAGPSRGGRARHLAARAAVLGLLGRMSDGAVIVKEGGARHLCGRPAPGEPIPEIEVLSAQVWSAVVSEGGAGLGRAYFSGWWDCASLEDLTRFLRIIVRNLDAVDRARAVRARLNGGRRPGRDRARLRRGEQQGDGGREAARDHIVAHYDLGNDFFALVLDDTLTYSCALFDSPRATLHEAQVAKLERICRLLDLSPADHVLEIGTGWGSFALHAAGRHGCRVTTTTISPAQHELASRRVKEAGLDDLVTVLETDYRDLTGRYDKLVSIEMIEAVDWREQEGFFRACSDLLAPAGAMALQAIVIDDALYDTAKLTEDFIKRYVFPGSSIPSVGSIVEHTARAGLRLASLQDIGGHYGETLRRWRDALSAHDAGIAALGLDESFRRLFAFYLSYCEAGFEERRISDVQCLFTKPAWRGAGFSRPA
jgi:cyclopropane-fatty-acyl-phospholipid synthase